ncbi:RelA/SpoT family protein [Campylobacter hominis]|uniref:GTP pyrophosphokinase (ATP:GTP 3'-pyrophosphotransferase)(PpGpp synthetase I) ((P)ppGpp synthetase) n=1 Tax=Campylobacter hominis (strain ATCC BAA-381 / DSM 21671 / CCUG 45161 / LMG 19568 / NCTC 13146 / CH001A) TaxID=360107 RepID=A7I2U1_CAMHC|nr:RelA/SpoT family protein [Campylobacter hominis]ABS51429.1 GTP pyrophosphokinase (ATP:GTP 3'-pyrophosphotransferase)(ppGpp synthetase I) ((P)ppGpp synthetase) [Campylobacter hominis ATCC BAA-381]UAK85923.1 RelA/SpoT family protein [Campylobacter hominis]SUW85350.1 GTP pyrophosphokinase (ATP:GTP 3'-pyrophosphotransferase)(ppGpp synthetase I) ((P)ppGpp synthetase) [Campylobacter hominis]
MDLKNRQINDDYLEHLIDDIVETNDIEGAKKLFYQIEQPTPLLVNAIQLCIRQHDGQFRKSGEPYAIHPILVSCIVAFLGGDDDMIIAALLHDVVEDTDYTLDKIIDEFGEGVAKLVEGLTKIVTIRDDKLAHSNEATSKLKATALTFRKMLLVSIEDVRVLVVKLCDRLHNMLTLGALRPDKQVRIAQETLLVYAPIAHRLGISAIKNFLEDLSFKYVMPHEYEKIDKYLTENKQQLWINLNAFSTKISELLLTNGFTYDSFKIQKRLKHYYSIYLKMQRKGISIEEVLDLLAVRIIVKEPEDCYLVLGIIHMKFNPLISRFKDYVALPKQNGYQTIHTTVFNENMIIEAQIRTFDMHQTAEYGVAAHWKYKYNGSINPKLDWLSDIGIKEDEDVENLYEYAKDSLYVEDIAVYSPKGGIFTLPRGATALDYAYEIHSEVGLRATQAYVNRIRVPLLTELKNGDIVHIITGNEPHYRCSWLNSVKTGKAKATIKSFCKQKLHDINQEVALNMLCAIFSARKKTIKNWLENENLIKKFSRIAYDSVYLKDVVNALKKYPKKEKLFFFTDKYEIKKQKFDNIVVYSNFNVSSVEFDYCCNPKRGDDIMGFRNGHDVSVHHKFCERALNLMRNGNENIFVKWTRIAPHRYKIILSIENKRGSLASFLAYLAKLDVDLVSIKLSENSEKSVDYFEMTIELNENLNSNDIKEKLKNKYKIIEFTSLNDAYKN